MLFYFSLLLPGLNNSFVANNSLQNGVKMSKNFNALRAACPSHKQSQLGGCKGLLNTTRKTQQWLLTIFHIISLKFLVTKIFTSVKKQTDCPISNTCYRILFANALKYINLNRGIGNNFIGQFIRFAWEIFPQKNKIDQKF